MEYDITDFRDGAFVTRPFLRERCCFSEVNLRAITLYTRAKRVGKYDPPQVKITFTLNDTSRCF